MKTATIKHGNQNHKFVKMLFDMFWKVSDFKDFENDFCDFVSINRKFESIKSTLTLNYSANVISIEILNFKFFNSSLFSICFFFFFFLQTVHKQLVINDKKYNDSSDFQPERSVLRCFVNEDFATKRRNFFMQNQTTDQSMESIFQNLPNDVIKLILRYLNNKDLSALRLTNRRHSIDILKLKLSGFWNFHGSLIDDESLFGLSKIGLETMVTKIRY